MNGDRTCPEAGRPDQLLATQGGVTAARRSVDWFALTEDNLPPNAVAPTPIELSAPKDAAACSENEAHIETAVSIEPSAPTELPTLEVPSACSIGGLRP